MASQPEIALLVSTYQRPGHLRRALLSIALQQNVAGQFELVVTDDGSQDETPELVEQFARSVNFPVNFTTHKHEHFQLARCRNEGVRASRAPYLLFLDGDCILPPDHVAQHLQRRRAGVTIAGDCCRLDEATSARIDEDVIRSGDYLQWIPRDEQRRLARQHRKARLYNLLRHPTKPKLIGNNIGIWRRDYERVNGYDENFQGWGCEDDDLRLRLKRAGVRIESIMNRTYTYHLWHPIDATAPGRWRDGANVGYFQRNVRLTRCLRGLQVREPSELDIRLIGEAEGRAVDPRLSPWLDQAGQARSASEQEAPEVEVLVMPGQGSFSGRADCNILVVLEPSAAETRAAKKAHILVADRPLACSSNQKQFPLDQFDQALRAVA